MKITLDIKENRLSTFLAFIKTLDYVTMPKEDSIPQWQKDEVNQRLKDLEKHPEKAIDFDQTMDRIEKKYDL
jgi:putative addiction module component